MMQHMNIAHNCNHLEKLITKMKLYNIFTRVNKISFKYLKQFTEKLPGSQWTNFIKLQVIQRSKLD